MAAITLVLLLVLFLYLGTNIYHFSETQPFSGDRIHNPYENIPENTIKANFHCHSRAWGGLTHGEDSDEEMINAYHSKGYDIAGLSNYHKISTPEKSQIPSYEHGFSIGKVHYLAIQAKRVSFWDFPLWQTASHQQTIINKLKNNAEIVAIAHPSFGGGREEADMKKITGYHLTEVLNHYRTSESHWDAALSTGKLSWIIANDDIHDLKDPEIFQRWNMIFCKDKSLAIQSLKQGKNYGVVSLSTNTENTFIYCKKSGDTSFDLKFEKPVDTIFFIGQHGVTRQKTVASDTASYTFRSDDTYIRVVAQNGSHKIFLNPLTRYTGNRPIKASDIIPKKNYLIMILWKLLMSSGISLLVFTFLKVLRLKVKQPYQT